MLDRIQTLNAGLETTSKKLHEVVVEATPSPQEGDDTDHLFLGIGMLYKGELSQGLSLNSLPMFCVVKEIQDLCPHSIIHVLIADIHALEQLEPSRECEIADVSSQLQAQVGSVLNALGVGENQRDVFIASQHPLFQFPNEQQHYVSRQSEDLRVAQETLHVGLKIGWQSTRQATNGVIRDEKYFDQQAIQVTPSLVNLAFARTIEGLSLAQDRGGQMFVPPYFSRDGIHFGNNIDIAKLFEIPQLKNHFLKVTRSLIKTLNISTKGVRTNDVLDEFVNHQTKV